MCGHREDELDRSQLAREDSLTFQDNCTGSDEAVVAQSHSGGIMRWTDSGGDRETSERETELLTRPLEALGSIPGLVEFNAKQQNDYLTQE